MIEYRPIVPDDINSFWTFLNLLDTQTSHMMYEPGERAASTTLSSLKTDILTNVIDGADHIRLALDNGSIVGYIHAERGKFNRTLHTAYIVAGILKTYRGQGIGTALFEYIDQWARANRITRLELTVECSNKAAKRLYEKSGFAVEGVRRRSMYVNGRYVDEYYMAKLITSKKP